MSCELMALEGNENWNWVLDTQIGVYKGSKKIQMELKGKCERCKEKKKKERTFIVVEE